MSNYPNGKKLAKIFLDTIRNYPGLKIVTEDIVSHIILDDVEFYFYCKNVTHEGNPYPLENRRAQLPRRKEFNDIKVSDAIFLFLGYDQENDVFVCWEPDKVKARLNNKTYVSFYSRLSIQQGIVEGEIKEEILSNGDKFVLFKRCDTISFFNMLDVHFPNIKNIEETPVTALPPKKKKTVVEGRILNIEDDISIKLLVDDLFTKNHSQLEIISACMNEFYPFYPKMSLVDWNKIVKNYINQLYDENKD